MRNPQASDELKVSFSKDISYDVNIQLADNIISKIKSIRILDTTSLGGKEFLVVVAQGDARNNTFLLAIDSIKTILPSNHAAHESILSANSFK